MLNTRAADIQVAIWSPITFLFQTSGASSNLLQHEFTNKCRQYSSVRELLQLKLRTEWTNAVVAILPLFASPYPLAVQ